MTAVAMSALSMSLGSMSVGSTFAQAALTGSLAVALLVAAAAGVVSFASPCVLPLVPGYLSYVTGMTGSMTGPTTGPMTGPTAGSASGLEGATGVTAQAGRSASPVPRPSLEQQQRWRLVFGACLFVLGFTAVFVALGAAFGALGAYVQRYDVQLSRWLGLLVVVMGLVFLDVLPGGGRAWQVRWRPAAGLAGAPVLGVVFGLGWAPCIGPTLAAVLSLATDQGTAWRGAALTAAYCVGLGLPFVLVAAFVGRSQVVLGVLRRRRQLISRLGGAGLVIVGLLLVSGVWNRWLNGLQGMVTSYQTVI